MQQQFIPKYDITTGIVQRVEDSQNIESHNILDITNKISNQLLESQFKPNNFINNSAFNIYQSV